jgi:sugar transferase (PEP-CTERM/EpsH1 system associated)
MNGKQAITKPITIGHVIYAFHDGGMERGILNIINFGDQERFRHIVLCLTQAGAFANQLRSPACEVVELRKRPGNDLHLPIRIAAAARRHQVDILHARGWSTLVETVVAARLAGIRATVYGFHGKTIEDLGGLSFERKWAQRIAVRWYQCVVTLNSRMRSEFATECCLPEERIRIIANGVDIETFYPRKDRGKLRATFGLPTDRFIVGNVARLDPIKNHEVILRALYRLREQGCQPFFLLIGEGSHRPVLEREIERLNMAEDVCLYGYSDRIPELLNCMDVYIQSSFYEGFSNTVLEAMACGLPILATDVGGMRDLFFEGREGFFFHPHDDETLAALIARLQKDSFLRRTIAEQVRFHIVENFSVQNIVHAYESIYLKLAVTTSYLKN